MTKLQICKLDFEKDIPAINEWENQFTAEEFASIKHFILEDHTYYGLNEVIVNNYEFFHIGEDERKYCLTIKDKDQIAGFILACIYDISVSKPELIIQYIVMRPDYQHKGLGVAAIKELLKNSSQYFEHNPTQVIAYINKENVSSLNMFTKLGFAFEKKTDDYLKAIQTTKITTNENENI